MIQSTSYSYRHASEWSGNQEANVRSNGRCSGRLDITFYYRYVPTLLYVQYTHFGGNLVPNFRGCTIAGNSHFVINYEIIRKLQCCMEIYFVIYLEYLHV